MALILAIEPDRRQAAQLTNLVRSRVKADLVLADTTEGALGAIGDRVPDLVLVPTFLSPQDDAALAGALRVIAAAARVQMLTIPVLADHAAPPKPSGLFARWRRRPTASPSGCDPSVFADQITAYLADAAAERQADRDDVVVEESIAELIDQASLQRVQLSEQVRVDRPIARLLGEPLVTRIEEPLVIRAAEPIAIRIEEPIASSVEEPVALIEEPVAARIEEPVVVRAEASIVVSIEPVALIEEPVAAMIEEPVTIRAEALVAASIEEPVALIEEPVAAAIEEPVVIRAEAPIAVSMEEPVASIEAALATVIEEPIARADEAPIPAAAPLLAEPVHVAQEVAVAVAAAEAPIVDFRPAKPLSQAELDLLYFAQTSHPTPDPPALRRKPAPKPHRTEWTELVASLRVDVERIRAERTKPESNARVLHLEAEGTRRAVRTKKSRPSSPRLPGDATEPTGVESVTRGATSPRAVQDQWGFFDPAQCGFAALLSKLEEITEAPEDASTHR